MILNTENEMFYATKNQCEILFPAEFLENQFTLLGTSILCVIFVCDEQSTLV